MPKALNEEQRKEVDEDPEVAKLLGQRSQLCTSLQRKSGSVVAAGHSSKPEAKQDYCAFLKAKQDLHVVTRRVRSRALKKYKAD